MKITTKIKKGIISALVVVLGVVSLSSYTADAQFLTQDGNIGGVPNIAALDLIPKPVRQDNLLGLFNEGKSFLNLTLDLVFRNYGSVILDQFVAFNNASFDHLFVGFSGPQNIPDPDIDPVGYANYPKLNVDGKIVIAALADPTAPPLEEVCVNDFGKFERCSVTVPTAQCGTANGVMTSTPPTTGLCAVGTPSSVTLSGGWYNWTCDDGTTTASCTARQDVGTTYSWNTGDWGLCIGSGGSCAGSWQQLTLNPVGSCTGGSYCDIGAPLGSNGLGCADSNGQLGIFAECSSNTTEGNCPSQYCTWNSGVTGNVGGTCEIGGPVADPSSVTPQQQGICGTATNAIACANTVHAVIANTNGSGADFRNCIWNPGTSNGNGSSTTQTISCAGPTNAISCTSQNSACTWNPSGGTQTRTVTCEDSSGTVVADSFCSSTPKPNTTQSCTSGGGTSYVGCDALCNPSNNIQCDSSLSGPGGYTLECQNGSSNPPTNNAGVCAWYNSTGTPIWANC